MIFRELEKIKERDFCNFHRVENQAGERAGVAVAPLPDSHRTATPTVQGFLRRYLRTLKRGLRPENMLMQGLRDTK